MANKFNTKLKQLNSKLKKRRFLRVIVAFLLIPVWIVIGTPIALILVILFAMPLVVLDYLTVHFFGIEIANRSDNKIYVVLMLACLWGFWKLIFETKFGKKILGKKVETGNVSVIEEFKNKSNNRSEVNLTKESIHMNENSIILKCKVCNSENKLNISNLNSNSKFRCHKCKNEFPRFNATINEDGNRNKKTNSSNWIVFSTIVVISVLIIALFILYTKSQHLENYCNNVSKINIQEFWQKCSVNN